MHLYGWDTAYATTQTAANGLLASNMRSLLQTFSFKASTCSIQGSFGPWRITGGSGSAIILAIPITDGQMSDPVLGDATLNGTTVTVQVTLKFAPSTANSSVKSLTFDFQEARNVHAQSDDGPPPQGSVTGLGIADPSGKLSDAQKQAIPLAIAECMVANAASISFVFADVNPDAVGAPPWLSPTSSDYCYAQPDGDTESYLVVMSMVNNHSATGLSAEFDASMMKDAPPGSNAFFSISDDLFLRHVVKPVLPHSFGMKESDISYDESKHEIVGQGDVKLEKIKKGTITYHPELRTLTVSIDDDLLVIVAGIHCGLKLGIELDDTITSKSRVKFDSTSSSVVFEETGKPQADPVKHIPLPLELINFIVYAIVKVVTIIVGNAVEKHLKDSAAKTLSLHGASAIVKWGGSTVFTPTGAGLAKNFYTQGRLA